MADNAALFFASFFIVFAAIVVATIIGFIKLVAHVQSDD